METTEMNSVNLMGSDNKTTKYVEIDAAGCRSTDVDSCTHVLSLIVDVHVLQVQVSAAVIHDSRGRVQTHSYTSPDYRWSWIAGKHDARQIDISTCDRLDAWTAVRYHWLNCNTQ